MQTEVLHILGFIHAREFITPEELRFLRGLIVSQYYQTILEKIPDRVAAYTDAGITGYHTLFNPNHAQMWPKRARTLSLNSAFAIEQTEFFQKLAELFKVTGVSDEEGYGWPEFYWRLVRPDSPSDIGPLHADRWFWDLSGARIPEGHRRIKVWLPIYAEPGKNGLLVRPSSHLEGWKYETVMREGVPKPSIVGEPEMHLLPAAPGDAIIFHDELIHGGALNKGNQTRVSLEFTLICKQ